MSFSATAGDAGRGRRRAARPRGTTVTIDQLGAASCAQLRRRGLVDRAVAHRDAVDVARPLGD